MNCKNCKYWHKYTDDFDVEYHGPMMGVCHSDKFRYKESSEKAKPDELMYWDDEGYSAGFETGADFGCVHFSLKEG
jgi:hypothetical protein